MNFTYKVMDKVIVSLWDRDGVGAADSVREK